MFEVFEKILNSNDDNICGNKFMNILFIYTNCYFKDIIEQINSFKKIKIDSNKIYNIDNENILLDLILMLEKLDTLCLQLGYAYFLEKTDILNQNGDEKVDELSKIGYEVLSTQEDKIQEEFQKNNTKTEITISSLTNSYSESSYKIGNVVKFLYKFIKYNKNLSTMLNESKKVQLSKNLNVTQTIMEVCLWPKLKKL